MRRKMVRATLGVLIFCFGIGSLTLKADAAEVGKKAIVVVSFGTTFADTRKVTTDAVAEKIKAAFPEYEVRQAFTSRIIIKRLAERDGLNYDTEKQALEKLKAEGYSEVIVQPLHIEAGDEYQKVSEVVKAYQDSKAFDKLALGRPILYFMGQEERPDDYTAAIEALKGQFPLTKENEGIVLMGHGGINPANAAYSVLQMKLQDANLNNVFIVTVDGYPDFQKLTEGLNANSVSKVTIMPFMLVAGDHANNDMVGKEKDSLKSRLEAIGIEVEPYIHGLGENEGIQNIYVQHVKDAMEGVYDKSKRSKSRPAIPVIE